MSTYQSATASDRDYEDEKPPKAMRSNCLTSKRTAKILEIILLSVAFVIIQGLLSIPIIVWFSQVCIYVYVLYDGYEYMYMEFCATD